MEKNKEKTVILFKCHFIDKHTIKEYFNLLNSCEGQGFDVIMLYDNTKNDFKVIPGVKYFLFNLGDFKNSGYLLRDTLDSNGFPPFAPEESIQWFHADFPPMFFYNKNPNYSYYWQIEFDVRFNGDWKYFFSLFTDRNEDLISTHVKSKGVVSRWGAWNAHNLNVDEKYLIRSFFPIARISNRGLKFLDEQFSSGKCGYCELITPTILNIGGFDIVDISNIDNSLYDYNTLGFYNNYSHINYRLSKIFPHNRNKLYHPVKKNNKPFKDIFLNSCERKIGQIGIFLAKNIPYLYSILKRQISDKGSGLK